VALARAIVDSIGDFPSAKWLEPSVGRGSFLEALASNGVESSRIRAVDIDRIAQPTDRFANVLRGRDFFAWARTTAETFDRIVGNPPFVAFDRLSPYLRRSAFNSPVPPFETITQGSNYWYAFLCGSLALLSKGGHLAFVLPAAWDYADYARHIRTEIHKHFHTVEVHRCTRPLFEDVQDGSVVLVARHYGAGPGKLVRKEYVTPQDMEKGLLGRGRSVEKDTVMPAPKRRPSVGLHRLVQLHDVLRIGIGAVTGDSDFFLLNESRRKELQLPAACLRPALTKAKHLTAGCIDTQVWRELRDRDERVWLFHPTDSQLSIPTIQRYLRLTHRKGGCDRSAYKVQSRSPWYRVRLPQKCDAFLSGMSSTGPWLALNQMNRLVATNTLYVAQFNEDLSPKERYALAITLQTTTVAAEIRSKCRVYAQGLLKLEPSDLMSISLFLPKRSTETRATYLKITECLAAKDVHSARRMADKWHSRCVKAS
jgi:hypothetical protein